MKIEIDVKQILADNLTLATDYSAAKHWLAKPGVTGEDYDVFGLYPTEYPRQPGEPLICAADHPSMQKRARENVETKGSAFMAGANVFIPYYRQASMDLFADLSPKNQAAFVAGPVCDTLAAFDYYITHLNQGRPFILASHSQGSVLMTFILAAYFKSHPDLMARMIAAYLIGFSVTEDYLAANPHLKFATGREDTGVIISYNTEAPGADEPNLTLLPHSLVINPVSWRRDETPAPAGESLGSRLVLRNEKDEVIGFRDLTGFADATLDLKRGVVLCSTANPAVFDEAGAVNAFRSPILHSSDIPLYYYDLRQNVKDRVASFFARQDN